MTAPKFIMIISGSVHCLFEQSGTFRDAFRSLGYSSFDYDISDSFNQTDFVVDLFEQIELSYSGESSLFDSFCKDDLIFAFFPCIHFCGISQTWFNLNHRDYRNWSYHRICDYMIDKNRLRSRFYGFTSYQFDKNRVDPMLLPSSGSLGCCSISRSLISPDYALNFIRDFIFGIPKNDTQLSLFP